MTQDQFYSWLDNPSKMDRASVADLREVLKRYPYYQAAQMMLAKSLKNENHIDQLNQLQLAAVMVPNRKRFHDYLHDKKKKTPVVELLEEESSVETQLELPEETEQTQEVERESLYDLIPEPIVYQLETADLPELPPKEVEQEEQEPEELSFSEWLAYTQTGKAEIKPVEAPEFKTEKPQPARSNFELIDHFLSQQKEKPSKRAEFFDPQKAGAKSLEEDFTVVSETLANIYFQQEKYELAQQAYQALSLKYPEKSVYFAARLKEIDGKLNSD